MYQKSPFPYLFVFVIIIASASFSNLTINRKIEQPIVYNVSYDKPSTYTDIAHQFKIKRDSTQIASLK